jgi:hypothetical protein
MVLMNSILPEIILSSGNMIRAGNRCIEFYNGMPDSSSVSFFCCATIAGISYLIFNLE